ncbi:MAG: SDR family oxidoreductase [Candidatus Kapabacteria bacterium]|jgi:3-oxoacyl-[acyl-carrier protein] reductase|nr:SDR family oxidoreductase [Candidatus Kapabacteria bacterium]
MNLSLSGKKALVCGSTQGIGLAIAECFAEAGAEVHLFARNRDTLKNVVESLPAHGKACHSFVSADFSNPEAAVKAIESIYGDSPNFDILINNTGGPAPGPILDETSNNLRKAFDSHVVMSQLLTQMLIPNMKQKQFGRIINIISIGAKQPVDNLGCSNTIRGAMASWSKTLSRELAGFGITVNNLLPGYTLTGRLESFFRHRAAESGKTYEEITNEIVCGIPAGRLGKPEELAAAALFLASESSSYITGINIPIDGGYLACL